MLLRRSVSTAGIHQNHAMRQAGLARPTDLCQRDLGLGLETDVVRNSYLAPTFVGGSMTASAFLA
jgi:hypothetical protein